MHRLFLGQVGNELSGGVVQRLLELSHRRESIFPLEGSKLGRVLQKRVHFLVLCPWIHSSVS